MLASATLTVYQCHIAITLFLVITLVFPVISLTIGLNVICRSYIRQLFMQNGWISLTKHGCLNNEMASNGYECNSVISKSFISIFGLD